ncbi:MAG: site-specific integrase [Thermoguttaceae bacterium]|nr:site-specific integrase [Thermoguttaceae bacterium]
MNKKSVVSPMIKRTWANKKRKPAAICYVVENGKRVQKSLGVWGTQDALDAYTRLVAEIAGNGTQCEEFSNVSVAFLCAKFYEDAERRADDPKLKFDRRELKHYEIVIRHLVRLYGDTPANKFTASCYRAFREHLVIIAPDVEREQCGVYSDTRENRAKKIVGKPKYRTVKKSWSENYVKKLMNYLKMIFSWGVGHDMVDQPVAARFKHVESLRSDLDVHESRLDVSDDIVKRTLPWLSPTVRDMVIIQRQNALRPNEVCYLRVGDIDRSGEFWTVMKLTKTKVPMIIKFCESDRKIIERRIRNKGADEFIFTPAESMQETWRLRASQRKTPVQPSQRKRAELAATSKLDSFAQSYSPSSYRNAIRYAIQKARRHGESIPFWTPYQLRHTAVTVTSYEHDRETASLLAGHTNLITTSIYEHKMERVKEDLARERQAYWTEE